MAERDRTVVFRVDASPEIGWGHMMRCIALGQAWRDAGGDAAFAVAYDSDDIAGRIANEGFEVSSLAAAHPDHRDLETMECLLAANPGCWVVADGYGFGPEYQERIMAAGHKLVVIDDNAHLPRYSASILVNPNVHAEDLNYSINPAALQLVGVKYALLRREFEQWSEWRREIPKRVGRIVVSLGGGRHSNMATLVLGALKTAKLPEADVVVVVGSGDPDLRRLHRAAGETGLRVQFKQAIPDMSQLMASADMAILGGGGTCTEAAFMGLPSCIIILAENQVLAAWKWHRMGAALCVGEGDSLSQTTLAEQVRGLALDEGRRQAMSREARKVVTGQGAQHVVGEMLGLGSVAGGRRGGNV